jgi:hypothetical protein
MACWPAHVRMRIRPKAELILHKGSRIFGLPAVGDANAGRDVGARRESEKFTECNFLYQGGR